MQRVEILACSTVPPLKVFSSAHDVRPLPDAITFLWKSYKKTGAASLPCCACFYILLHCCRKLTLYRALVAASPSA